MKPRRKDYLTIGMALLAIFLCGYGIGFLLGEKKGQQKVTASTLVPSIEKDGKDAWVERTLDNFDRDLELTPDQEKAVAKKIEQAYEEIRKSRGEALLQYSRHILDLHRDLMPLLDESQRAKVEAQQDRLRKSLDLSFQ
jgi:histidinol dehydrogenase